MAKKKTTTQKNYILIDENNDNVLLIGTLDDIREEIESLINEEDDVESFSVYELGERFDVSAQSSGFDVSITPSLD